MNEPQITAPCVGDGGLAAEKIALALMDGQQPFLATRTGNVEARAITQGKPTDELRFSAGWYCANPANERAVFADWAGRYARALQRSDLVMVVPSQRADCEPLLQGIPIKPGVCRDTMQLPSLLRFFQALCQSKKKILVVNSKVNLMRQQAPRLAAIFPGMPFEPSFADRLTYFRSWDSYPGHEPHESWSDTFSSLCEGIDESDFDVAILGCGCYGLPLCDYIRHSKGKTAFYVGGFIQLLFGIHGKRWLSREREKAFFNEHWISVPKALVPENSDKFEGGAYW